MKKILKKLREQLNSMVNSNKFTTEEILAVCQELDELIVSYYEHSDESTSSSPTKK